MTTLCSCWEDAHGAWIRTEPRRTLYAIWMNQEHGIPVEDGQSETAGEAVACHHGRMIPHPKQVKTEDDHDEPFASEDVTVDDAASLTASDACMTERDAMWAMPRNAH